MVESGSRESFYEWHYGRCNMCGRFLLRHKRFDGVYIPRRHQMCPKCIKLMRLRLEARRGEISLRREVLTGAEVGEELLKEQEQLCTELEEVLEKAWEIWGWMEKWDEQREKEAKDRRELL